MVHDLQGGLGIHVGCNLLPVHLSGHSIGTDGLREGMHCVKSHRRQGSNLLESTATVKQDKCNDSVPDAVTQHGLAGCGTAELRCEHCVPEVRWCGSAGLATG